MMKFKKIILLMTVIAKINVQTTAQGDPYMWLENVDDPKALEWVESKNKPSFDILSQHPKYQDFYNISMEILDSKDRIAAPSIIGQYVYNFWQDQKNPRGIWRRMLKTDYMAHKTDWESVIDIDALSAKDNKKWVFKGASPLEPSNNRFLVSLSNGGGDATVVKEFDAIKKSFVEDGFYAEESKGSLGWIDQNTVFVARDFGKGTMTESGYPMVVKIWKRGTKLSDAKEIYRGETSNVSAYGYKLTHLDKNYLFLARGMTFYTNELNFYNGKKITRINKPDDASFIGLVGDRALIELKSDWTSDGKIFKQGSIISSKISDFISGKKKYSLVIAPEARTSIESVITMGNYMLVAKNVNVKSELFKYGISDGKWTTKKIDAPGFGAISIGSSDDKSGDFFFYFTNFLNPSTLYHSNIKDNKVTLMKSLPHFFDAAPYEVRQLESISKDGTKIPYFLVARKDVKMDGSNPVHINAYGGFEVSRLPSYSATIGRLWLDQGGIYVLANIRGGGEFGPAWHQAGLKENRQRIYDDLHSVAEDLIAKKYTTSKKLGISGGSNGGLLVGVAFTQRPDLYNAVVCQVPLLDMQRYNKLLAGASWMGEYGNPDVPAEWAYISKYSPYHNLKKDANYPEVFFTTSTRDDRVHPGHAREMVAKMEDMGYKVFYYENTEGGHAGSSTNDQRAKASALMYAYLGMKLNR
jgi:prolyl oligopeptidase